LTLLKVENQVAADVTVAYKARVAAARRMKQAAPSVAEAIESLRLNLINIRRGARLPGATRPIEVLQPIQALAQARLDYLDSVLAHNRAQFRLYRALGMPPLPTAQPVNHAPVPHDQGCPTPIPDNPRRLQPTAPLTPAPRSAH
jgi:outer membrane protein TolC